MAESSMSMYVRRIGLTNQAGDASDVRFGSLADILISPRHDRFTPNNGRWAAHPSQHLAVGL